MSENEDKYGYGSKSLVEIREGIANLNKEIMKLESDKKDYVGGMNGAIKDVKDRLKDAIGHLKQKEVDAMSKKLEEAATTMIQNAAASE